MAKILEMGNFHIRDVVFGLKTEIKEGILFINRTEMQKLVLEDERIKTAYIHIAKPGDSTRFVCVKDIVPIRKKIHGERGQGRTHNIPNVVVTTLGQMVAVQEGVLCMDGEGAEYSPFSKMMHVCLEIKANDGVVEYEHEEAVREAGLKASAYLGEALNGLSPDKVESFRFFDSSSVDPILPRFVYGCTLLVQDLLHHNFIDGKDPKKKAMLPMIVENPLEVLDGLVVSGNCVSACDKSTTWHHWNNAILKEAFKRHKAGELNFVGMVLSGLMTSMDEKEEMASKAVKLMKKYKPDIALLSKEGFGNPDADVMLLTRLLEKAGVKTASIHDEWPGSEGISPPLKDMTPEADAMVSTGNATGLITLRPVKKTLGPQESLARIAGVHSDSLKDDGTVEIEVEAILGSTHQFGDMNLMCEEV